MALEYVNRVKLGHAWKIHELYLGGMILNVGNPIMITGQLKSSRFLVLFAMAPAVAALGP